MTVESRDEGQPDETPRARRRDGPRLRGTLRRIFRDEEGDDRRGDGPLVDARELLGAVLETGDKAKTEIVRMVAREVRAYLEALRLHEDLRNLLTNYSLEVHASFHLRPLADAPAAPKGEDRPPADEPEPAEE